MKDAIGGIFNIQAILIFIVLAMGLLLFSVNYAKAFRVKNEVRRIIEEYEGFTESSLDKVDEVADKYSYKLSYPADYMAACTRSGYDHYYSGKNGDFVICYKKTLVNVKGTDDGDKLYKGAYYTIATFVDIDIPLINKIFSRAVAPQLKIVGETALIYSSGNNSEISG